MMFERTDSFRTRPAVDIDVEIVFERMPGTAPLWVGGPKNGDRGDGERRPKKARTTVSGNQHLCSLDDGLGQPDT